MTPWTVATMPTHFTLAPHLRLGAVPEMLDEAWVVAAIQNHLGNALKCHRPHAESRVQVSTVRQGGFVRPPPA
jgi:hypothetical protein